MPLISIITPAFNASKFLQRLVRCVQSQTFKNYEHIIVDDCSTDDSYQILNKLASEDHRIKILKLPKNGGVVVARNEAIAIAEGRYLAFLDADDLWLPIKLETQLEFMQKNSIAFSFSDYRFISEQGDKIGRRISGLNKIGWSLHHMTRYLGCLTIMIDRNIIQDFNFGDVSSEYRAEDFLAWSRIIKKYGPARRCPHDLARYSQVSNSRSSSGIVAAKSVWRLYRDIEEINTFTSAFYFLNYIAFSAMKRMICRPSMLRSDIENIEI